MDELDIGERLRELRESFDRSFASLPSVAQTGELDFVTTRIGTTSFALPLSALAGLERGRKVVPVPGAAERCLGIAGVRGAVVPVFSLGRALGLDTGPEDPARGWLALCGKQSPVALAFARLEGHLRLRPGELLAAGEGDRRRHVREAFQTNGGSGLVIDVASVLASLQEGGTKANG